MITQVTGPNLLTIAAAVSIALLQSTATYAAPQISGNSVTLPDGGWIEIQDRNTFQTLCQGQDSCTVSPGIFNVINHTSGERFLDIEVRSNDASENGSANSTNSTSTAGISVSDNTVSVEAGSWIEVQDSVTYQSICQGLTSCEVSPGTYTVINHSSGERFNDIAVGIGGTTVVDSTPIVNDAIATDLIRQAFEIFNGKAFDDRLERSGHIAEIPTPSPEEFVEGLTRTSFVSEPPGQPLVASVATYSCSNGGTIEHTSLFGGFVRDNDFKYDNCLLDGNLIDGNILAEVNSRFNIRYIFDNYRLTFEPNGVMEINGTYLSEIQTRHLGIAFLSESVESDIDYSFEFSGGSLKVAEADFDYTYHFNSFIKIDGTPFTDTRRTITEDSTFLMTPPFNDKSFRVTMDSRMDNQRDDSGLYFDIGAMKIESIDDGSSLILNAGTGNINTAEVTLEDANGVGTSVVYPWSTWADVFCITSRSPGSVSYRSPTCGVNQ